MKVELLPIEIIKLANLLRATKFEKQMDEIVFGKILEKLDCKAQEFLDSKFLL